ncbi:MAG: hypothetical protein ACI9TV_001739 [Sulfurimonas sp.]|jgi:hypothetical protein|uniref:Lcl C-terminal domain-containing protein n=1 Tax=Sulfurimonas sp. TaxID=2022749 RepID=UPI0039E5E35D
MKKTSIVAIGLVLFSTMLRADINIKSGWQLLGATQDINTSIFDSTCIDYVWKYDTTDINNLEWQIHVANAVNYNNSMTPITLLTKGEGYWVKGNSDCVIPLAETIAAPTSTLKKTGQTNSYDTNIYSDSDEWWNIITQASIVTDGSVKDDGSYQSGVTVSYTRDDVNGTVIDNVTNLMWQDDAVTSFLTWKAAETLCSGLVLDGYKDWRVPTRKELVSLIDYGHYYPSINPIFQHTGEDHHWTSTTLTGNTDRGWIVYFSDGHTNLDNKASGDGSFVRCVRTVE